MLDEIFGNATDLPHTITEHATDTAGQTLPCFRCSSSRADPLAPYSRSRVDHPAPAGLAPAVAAAFPTPSC